jgi:Armadillo/beta-catenin-like repeat
MTRFSAAILRRKLLQALTCGGCSLSSQRRAKVATLSPLVKSDRLGELISEELSESASDNTEVVEMEMKSEQELEEFQRVVAALHPYSSNAGDAGGDRRREAAMEIRRMAKDDAEARETLAMLGAIPPLVGMLDAELEPDSQVAALYAILNLAIGNDM